MKWIKKLLNKILEDHKLVERRTRFFHYFSSQSCHALRFNLVEITSGSLVWLDDYVSGSSLTSKSVSISLLRSRFLVKACCFRIYLTFIISTIATTDMMNIKAHLAHKAPSPENTKKNLWIFTNLNE